MKRRFVIILHSGYGPEHYDLMVESGPALATWRLDRDPRMLATDAAISVRRLPDHRIAYLEYEGPVSGGRGAVARLAGGEIDVVESSDDLWRVRSDVFGSDQYLELRRESGDRWLIRMGPGK